MLCLIELDNATQVVPREPQKADKFQQLSLLDGLDELGMIKQVIAKDNPFIINLELPQEQELPELPQGMKIKGLAFL